MSVIIGILAHFPSFVLQGICLGFHSKLAEPRTHAESAFLIGEFEHLGKIF
jgi:hypothetical protein